MEALDASELTLYVDNDSALYSQKTQPIVKNLAKKKAAGTYNRELAVKAFMYLADAGARSYARTFGGEWNRLFPSSVRRSAASAWAREFEQEYKLGNFDHLLPASSKSARGVARGATRRTTRR